MIDLEINEQYSTQIPALQLLIKLGYEYLPTETIRQQRREKNSNLLLEDILEQQLKKLNHIHFKGQKYLFSEANIQEAIQRLKNVRYDGLIKTNEEIYDYLTLGTSLEQTLEGNSKSYGLRYIDWQNWQNNCFHVTAEFSVERNRSSETCRLDIVLFVNGIPFVIIECKSPTIDHQQAIDQLLDYQRDQYIPKLFTYSQLLIATNSHEIRYAATGTSGKFWALWREQDTQEQDLFSLVNTPLSEEQKKALFMGRFTAARPYFDEQEKTPRQLSPQDHQLYSLCRPERLLDLTYNSPYLMAAFVKLPVINNFLPLKIFLNGLNNETKKTDAKEV